MILFYEWSSNTKQTEKYDNFKKGDIIFFANDVDKLDIKPIRYKIKCIEYDANAPDKRFERINLICKKARFMGLFSREVSIPKHWVGKTYGEGIENFFKYREQIKKYGEK
jgi:hypothetical protein